MPGCLAWLGAGAVAWTLAAADAAPWFQRALVGMEVGPTGAQFGYSDPGDTRYCARFDGREIARRVRAAHGEYLVMWARDGDYAYYDSKLLPKAPGLGASGKIASVFFTQVRLTGAGPVGLGFRLATESTNCHIPNCVNSPADRASWTVRPAPSG